MFVVFSGEVLQCIIKFMFKYFTFLGYIISLQYTLNVYF